MVSIRGETEGSKLLWQDNFSLCSTSLLCIFGKGHRQLFNSFQSPDTLSRSHRHSSRRRINALPPSQNSRSVLPRFWYPMLPTRHHLLVHSLHPSPCLDTAHQRSSHLFRTPPRGVPHRARPRTSQRYSGRNQRCSNSRADKGTTKYPSGDSHVVGPGVCWAKDL